MPVFQSVSNFIMAVIVTITGLLFTGQMPKKDVPQPEAGPITRYVNPFVGTGSIPWASGMTHPGAAAPFGAVRLGPDTCFPFGINIDNVGTGGYWNGKTRTYGFSHNRISGAGLIDGGLFRVTPGLGKVDPLKRKTRPLLFTHAMEQAQAGFYAVWLPEAACMAEMTATVHTGVHRYTFTSSKDAHLFLDATSKLGSGAEIGSIRVVDNQTIEGACSTKDAFFRAEFSVPFTATVWNKGKLISGAVSAEGEDTGVDLNFGNCKDKPIIMHLGISFVSQTGAEKNLKDESASLSFDQTYAKTMQDWETRLGSIEVKSGDENIKRIFYTAMYHAMLHPTNLTDVDGKYLGFDKTIGTANGYTYRSDLSLWDTFRTTHPLYCLVAPDIQRDSAQSLLRMAERHGGFPRWPKGGSERASMFGTPANMVMTETYLKGLMNREDAVASLNFMKQTALGTTPEGFPFRARDYYEEYNKLGYVPSDTGDKDRSVSRTLEYAWSDYASYNLATALGNEADAALFKRLSQNHKNLFDPSTKYFRPKNSAGEWQISGPWSTEYYDAVLPIKFAAGFSEGSARQYRWHSVQDPQWLITSIGGKEKFVKELDAFMKDASLTRAALDPGSGWWVGNQHNYHAPYMFNEAGRPDLTQKWVRWTLANRFADAPNGLDGNDDLGALSAWYIFSAMGFYPIAGTDRYWLGSPAVEEAKLHLDGGKVLTVKAVNQSAKNVYVKQVSFNGTPITETSFNHDLIKNGGTLEFVMSAKP